MPRPPARRRALLLALLALAGGCGERPAPPEAAPVLRAGPPRWSAARDEAHPGGVMVDVRAEAPCRLRVLLRGEEERSDGAGVRTLAAGETVRLWWEATGPTPLDAGVLAPEADRAAGRTEPQGLTLTFGWMDAPGVRRLVIVGARPGRAQPLEPYLAAPPAAAQPLAFGQELDLAAVGLLDGAATGVTLVGGDGPTRARGALGPDDRVRIQRLVLRVERMEP